MSVEDKVKKLIAEKLNVDPSEVIPEAKFVDDLGADSLDLVELIMFRYRLLNRAKFLLEMLHHRCTTRSQKLWTSCRKLN